MLVTVMACLKKGGRGHKGEQKEDVSLGVKGLMLWVL